MRTIKTAPRGSIMVYLRHYVVKENGFYEKSQVTWCGGLTLRQGGLGERSAQQWTNDFAFAALVHRRIL